MACPALRWIFDHPIHSIWSNVHKYALLCGIPPCAAVKVRQLLKGSVFLRISVQNCKSNASKLLSHLLKGGYCGFQDNLVCGVGIATGYLLLAHNIKEVCTLVWYRVLKEKMKICHHFFIFGTIFLKLSQ